jgi:hypothetical protein
MIEKFKNALFFKIDSNFVNKNNFFEKKRKQNVWNWRRARFLSGHHQGVCSLPGDLSNHGVLLENDPRTQIQVQETNNHNTDYGNADDVEFITDKVTTGINFAKRKRPLPKGTPFRQGKE